jgi:hypothetical protein
MAAAGLRAPLLVSVEQVALDPQDRPVALAAGSMSL